MRFKVKLRGKEWTASIVGDALEQVADRNAEKLKFNSLTVEEFQAVDAARTEARRAFDAQYIAEKKEELRQLAEGAVRIRRFIWQVEDDRIWRTDPKGIVTLKFSELTNDEICSVMWARERQVQNRGIGGFFRRLSRKTDHYVPRDGDVGSY